jgi:peptidoglycan/xylan/chitin deacetylase (PgdA/CDA1 family)
MKSVLAAMIPVLSPVARRMTARYGRVTMFHRFAPQPAFRRLTTESFEWRINYLRRHYDIVSLAELRRRLKEGAPLDRCVVLTFDDGHRDFIECAYPILEKYGIPATVYLVSEFIDRRIWLWSDAIHWMAHEAADGRYRFDLDGSPIDAAIADAESRNILWEQLADRALMMTADRRNIALGEFAREFRVRLPQLPTDEYAGATWDELRRLDPKLLHVGAHSCTHPILSRCTPDEQSWEIEQCRATIEARLDRPVDAFCYPNGRYGDFNADTLQLLRRAGFTSAVTSEDGMVAGNSDPLLLPRIGAGEHPQEFRKHLDGIAGVREALRGRQRRLS